MSSENPKTENALADPPVKHTWNVHLKTIPHVHDAVIEDARREERSISYIVSKALEKYYEEKSKLKIV